MWKKIKNFILDWVWQLPQNLLGIIYRENIESVHYPISNSDNYKVYLKWTQGAVTLGKYIFIYKECVTLPYIIKHESGHVKQSKMLGPLYLLIIGIPSILWAATHRYILPEKDYFWFYTEKWANKLAGL